jgi:DNA-binding YbaB/EbfC family protein
MLKGLGGLGGLGDMANMMKAATEMQAKYAAVQEELAQMHVVGQAGGDLVKVRATAKGVIKKVVIDPSILVDADRTVIEDLILAAVKSAQAKARAQTKLKMDQLAEEMGVPPGMNLPF